MNGIEILVDLARRPQAAAEELRSTLTPELLNAHPHHDNSIAWLLWHAGREIDEQLSHLSGNVSVWIDGGFQDRFDLGVGPHEHGYGHTPDEARAIHVTDADLLIDYLSAAIDAQVDHLETLGEADLARVIDERWDPPVTLGTRMVSMTDDAAVHVGQAAYIAGMGAAAFE